MNLQSSGRLIVPISISQFRRRRISSATARRLSHRKQRGMMISTHTPTHTSASWNLTRRSSDQSLHRSLIDSSPRGITRNEWNRESKSRSRVADSIAGSRDRRERSQCQIPICPKPRKSPSIIPFVGVTCCDEP